MGYYLFDNPPAIQQFHRTRNGAGWTGGVLIHTAENVMDNVGPDTGAENVAAYIQRRTSYGSYHVLADSDSVIELLPPTATAFHCAASGYNSTTVGVSYACRSVDLDVNSQWFRQATDRIAGVLVRWWRDSGFDPNRVAFVPAPRTREALGLSTHGDAQPADRSDAWTRHPQRAQLEAAFLASVRRFAGGPSVPTPPGVDPIMNKPVMMREPDGTVWMYYSGTPWRVHVKSVEDVATFQFFGIELKGVDRNQAAFFRRYSQVVKCK